MQLKPISWFGRRMQWNAYCREKTFNVLYTWEVTYTMYKKVVQPAFYGPDIEACRKYKDKWSHDFGI